MHLNEVKVLLKQLCFLSRLVNDVDFVAKDDDWNTKLNFEDSFAKLHFKANVLCFITIRVEVISLTTCLEVFFALNN